MAESSCCEFLGLELSVHDGGQGVPSTEVEQLFFAERPRVHPPVLLHRRLQGLFGRSFQRPQMMSARGALWDRNACGER